MKTNFIPILTIHSTVLNLLQQKMRNSEVCYKGRKELGIALPTFFSIKNWSSFGEQGFACALSWLQTLKLQCSADPKWAHICWRNIWEPILYFSVHLFMFSGSLFQVNNHYFAIFLVWRLFQNLFFFLIGSTRTHVFMTTTHPWESL